MKLEIKLELGNKNVSDWFGFSIPILSMAAVVMAISLILINLSP